MTIIAESAARPGAASLARFRLVANRDESRQRPPALPPRIERCGEQTAILPVDPAGGGTWIGVNDAGLALTLLNVYVAPAQGRSRGLRSRGLILPPLLACATLDEALQRVEAITHEEYGPFRLVLLDEIELAEVISPGDAAPHVRRGPLCPPRLFTSSGLGDDLVEPPRRQLFDEYLTADGQFAERQDAYHRHSWPDDRARSVCIARDDARTVSATTIEVGAERVLLRYHPEAPDQPAEDVVVTLPRARPT